MNKAFLILVITVLFVFIGCSSGSLNDTLLTPGIKDSTGNNPSGTQSHINWGLYQFIADPVNEVLDVTTLRVADMHVNVVPFLEPPPLLNLTLESLEFNGNLIDADIGLRHPFLGLNEFTGFDVCGILISNGSLTGYTDTDLRMAGPGDTRLLNPDGYARWWNPAEFPVNDGTIFAYNDGLLGTPDSYADYNCTLNGYKYFCDDLIDPDAPLSDIVLENRGMFSPGQKNIRHYTIELGTEGLVFNYAVDACWQFPNGDPPWQAPDDFAPEANRVEPRYISVNETDNSLYYDDGDFGGELHMSIDVYDWFNAEMNTLYIEAANGIIPEVGPLSPAGGGEGYSTYTADITDAYPTAPGDLDLLITIRTEGEDFQGFISGTNTSAYFIHTTIVADELVTIPEDPVVIDPNPVSHGTVIAVDENGVIHAAYANKDDLYWAYSSNQGASWSTLGSIYQPSGDLMIYNTLYGPDQWHLKSLSMCAGPTGDGYIYIAWTERSTFEDWPDPPNPHFAMKAGRMPIDNITPGAFEYLTVWDHPAGTGGNKQKYDPTQIVVTDNGEIVIYSMKYLSTGNFNCVYWRAADFSSLNMLPEKYVENYLVSGYLTYTYVSRTIAIAADSNNDVFYADSGNYGYPSSSWGSFILRNNGTPNSNVWNFFTNYTHSGSNDYWDNQTQGLFIDEGDVIHWVSQYQYGGQGSSNEHGTWTLVYGEGPSTGTITLQDPIPDMVRTIPEPGYPNASYDYEFRHTSVVEDGGGLTYIVFQDCLNRRDAYYITWDGASWDHTDDWVKINTTTDQFAYCPYAVRGLDGYVYVTYTDIANPPAAGPGSPVFVAIKE